MAGSLKQHQLTRGGLAGHLFRRVVHVFFLIIFPWFNYHLGLDVGHFVGLSWTHCLWIFFLIVILLEIFRIRYKWVIFGQRQHEAYHISSVVWALLAAILVVQFAPIYAAYAILFTCAIVDPMMGELRQVNLNSRWVFLLGLLAAFIIWLVVLNYFKIHLWHACYYAPLMVIAEWPNLAWIDDNALMMLVPLIVSLLPLIK